MLIVASFVGMVAAGQTFVILIGGIDLSVPWVLNARGDPARDDFARPGRAGALRRDRADARHGRAGGLPTASALRFLASPPVVMTLAMNGIVEGLTLGLSRRHDLRAVRVLRAAVVQAAVHGHLPRYSGRALVWARHHRVVSIVLSFDTSAGAPTRSATTRGGLLAGST